MLRNTLKYVKFFPKPRNFTTSSCKNQISSVENSNSNDVNAQNLHFKGNNWVLKDQPPMNLVPEELKGFYKELQTHLEEKDKLIQQKRQTQKNAFDCQHNQTEFANGLNIITQKHGDESENVTICVILKFGSKNEIVQVMNNRPLGASQIIKSMAFSGFNNKSKLQITNNFEQLGMITECGINREFILYGTSVPISNMLPALNLMAEAIFKPDISKSSISEAIEQIKFDILVDIEPTKQDTALNDQIHKACYKNTCHSYPAQPDDLELLNDISVNEIKRLLKSYFLLENTTIVIGGIDEEKVSNTFLNEISQTFEVNFKNNTFENQKN